MAIYRGPGGAGDATGDATNASALALAAKDAAQASATSAASSATAAANSATEADTSETSAATSASNAAGSATTASTAATNASNSATAADTSADEAAASASDADDSATAAANSATSASTSASAASTSATNAASSASSASTSASTATTKASEASTSATNAASSASTASTAATNASNSASAAATSETNAASSASSASTSASNASTSASTATTQATNAASSASAAATSETNAASSASAASTSASNASTSATNAAASATSAATSASEAAASAVTAATFDPALYLAKSGNLSGLANTVTAANNIGLNPYGNGFKNRIINGAMMIDQRNKGASVATSSASAFTYTVDRWAYYVNAASKFTVQRTPSETETGFATRVGAGFTNYLAMTSTSAYTPSSTDIMVMTQPIEGFNFADMAWGTANAKAVTLSFWAYSSLTGTHSGSIGNVLGYSYPFSFSIPTANTWTQISVTIAGPTTSTWPTDNTAGLYLFFNMGSGSAKLGTAGAWSATPYYGATGSVSVVGTSGATFYITGVQLEKGSTATSFDYRPYGTELQLAQRYYAKLGANANGSATYQAYCAGGNQANNITQNFALAFPQFMRASPTIAYSGNIGVAAAGGYVTISSIGAAHTGVSSSLIQTNSPAVGSAGSGAVLLSNADSNAFISLTSEL